MEFLLYFSALIFITVPSLSLEWPYAGCIKELDRPTCVYIYYCTKFLSENNNYRDEIDNQYYQVECSDKRIYYNGYGLLTSKSVKYKAVTDTNSPQSTVPEIQDNSFKYSTISLDLSYNDYNFSPTIAYLLNLITLNMSKNYLTEAKLSNEYELEKLTNVDFSYNIINAIEVRNHEYVYKNLKKLNLAHNYLAIIPDGIFAKFVELETLDLSHNYIDTLNVLTFEGIKEISYLHLSHNRITDINSSLLRFNKLIELDLSNNNIGNIKTADFEKLSALKKLDLGFNSILDIQNGAFNSLGLVEYLDLSNNVLNNLEKNIFTNMSSLKNLNVSNNHLTVLAKYLFKGNCITTFSITGNLLEGSLLKGTFEGLNFITELDLSKQQLISIEDYAFFGLNKIEILLLNDNNIQSMSKMSFKTLTTLAILDLSRNHLTDLGFEKDNLISLRTLSLQKNDLALIKPEYFNDLKVLEYLDLSNNKISQLEPNCFASLNDLINIQISNNPISGILEENTFNGLYLLPNLDISGSLLVTISNNSFQGMTELKDLNISHSKINEVQFNAFVNTGSVECLDLSFNELINFDLNTTALINLNTLILNNNRLTSLSSSSYKGLSRLNKLILSHNNIENIQKEALMDQKDLRYLDLSFNSALKFSYSQIENSEYLVSLFVSGIKTNITFKGVENSALSDLEITHSGIQSIPFLELKRLKNLENLVLNNNDIITVEIGAFTNLTRLRKLDLSYNKMRYIQPGALKENSVLYLLNISHNCLTTVSYGIFRGLIYLNTIDMSFNSIEDLESERFFEVKSLSELIVDHNKIRSFNAHEFIGTSLTTLSIGDNPLPCNVLINFKKENMPFNITSMRIDESANENVDGITCNMNDNKSTVISKSDLGINNNNILIDIKNILHNISTAKISETYSAPVNNNDSQYMSNAINEMQKLNVDFNSAVINLTSRLVEEYKNTNLFYDKVLKVLTASNTVHKTTVIPIPKDNGTNESLIPYINKIKEDLEYAIAVEKQNILAEVNNKISSLKERTEATVFPTIVPNHEALLGSKTTDSKSFMFIEICVGLILLLLIGFILYKLYNLYNSGVFVPRSRSYSTRNLPDAMENSAL